LSFASEIYRLPQKDALEAHVGIASP